jgi:2-oxoacid:acceptor oxidoreductase gamma subunit (pyruvate/2-ketoisovalerate family)
MHEIVILGRGGQGAQTAGNLLARAFFDEGKYVQTFATYGGARRGTPVMASIRVDARPIRARSNIENAAALLCFDDSLLDGNFLRLAGAGALVMVNSARGDDAFADLGDVDVRAVDGKRIARANDLGKVVNSALLGAFVAALGAPGIETMVRVIEASAPARKPENVAACRSAYDLMCRTTPEVTA